MYFILKINDHIKCGKIVFAITADQERDALRCFREYMMENKKDKNIATINDRMIQLIHPIEQNVTAIYRLIDHSTLIGKEVSCV